MPAIPKGSLVLVTGASGFVGIQTVKAFLDAGYAVRGTVRSAAKGEYIKNLFRRSGAGFEYVVVGDISKLDAFDAAVQDVVGIAHTASPFHFAARDVHRDMIEPAVNGTLGILHSAAKYGAGVKRVVVTSSMAAVMDTGKVSPQHYDETDWNKTSPLRVTELGNATSPVDQYCASKTLAEEAFWRFFTDASRGFDGVAVNPVMVYGPVLQDVSRAEQLNTSVKEVYDAFAGNHTTEELAGMPAYNVVDVRDVALAHVRALEVEDAGGQRFLASNGVSSPLDLLAVFEKYFPHAKGHPKPVPTEGAHTDVDTFDGGKAARVLGIKYISVETSVRDTVESLVDKVGLQVE